MNATELKPSLKKFDEAQPGDFVYEPEYGDPMTKQEFIDLAEGNLVVSRNLFDCCEWQHPATLIDEHDGLDFFRSEPVDVDRQMAEAIAQQDTNFKRTHEAIGLHVTALSKFMPTAQLKTMIGLVNGEEGAFFSEKLDELHMLVDTMPKTYEQDGMGDEAIAYLHYFKNGADWYITERDMEVRKYRPLACQTCMAMAARWATSASKNSRTSAPSWICTGHPRRCARSSNRRAPRGGNVTLRDLCYVKLCWL